MTISKNNTLSLKLFHSSQQVTIPTLISLFILIIAFLYVYLDTIKFIIAGWFQYNGSHGLIIFIISLFIIWSKKNYLIDAHVEPKLLAGSLLVICGCLFFFVGNIGAVLLIQEFALILTILGLVLLILGDAYFKILFLPIAYLIFMFPFFNELLGNFSVYFQELGASIASFFLRLWGMPVYKSGHFLELPHVHLEVARVCSGINHITALVSLAIPLSYITRKSVYGKFFFVLITFFIGILSNGMRIALIGIWTMYAGTEIIHGPFGILYSSTVFAIVIGLLILISLKFKTLNWESKLAYTTRNLKQLSGASSLRSKSLPILVGCCLMLILAVIPMSAKLEPIFLKTNFDGIPKKIGGWIAVGASNFESRLNTIYTLGKKTKPDSILNRKYRDQDGNLIELFIGYYARQGQGKEIVSHHYDWLHDNSVKVTSFKDSPGRYEINATRYRFKNEIFRAFFWYNINGKIVVNRYQAKISTVLNAILHRRTDGSLVVITMQNGNRTTSIEFNDKVLFFIREFIANYQKFMAHEQEVKSL